MLAEPAAVAAVVGSTAPVEIDVAVVEQRPRSLHRKTTAIAVARRSIHRSSKRQSGKTTLAVLLRRWDC